MTSTHAMAGRSKYTRAMFYLPEPETPEELYYYDKERMVDDEYRRQMKEALERQHAGLLSMLEKLGQTSCDFA